MSSNEVVVTSLDSDEIHFPAPDKSIDLDKAKLKRLMIAKHAVVITNRNKGANSVETGLQLEGIKHAMGFESNAQARVFIASQDLNDIHNEDTVLTPALQEALFIIAEEAIANYDTQTQAECHDTMSCLASLSDAESVAIQRLLINQENQDKWPQCRKQFLKETQPEECGISGGKLDPNPDVDHEPRRIDSPENTLNHDVLTAVNHPPHIDKHNKNRKRSAAWMKEQAKAKPDEILGSKLQPVEV